MDRSRGRVGVAGGRRRDVGRGGRRRDVGPRRGAARRTLSVGGLEAATQTTNEADGAASRVTRQGSRRGDGDAGGRRRGRGRGNTVSFCPMHV